LVSYTRYFFDHSLSNWLSSQAWMVAFYRSSQVSALPLITLVSILTGWYKGWWPDATWIRVEEWSLTWPLGIATLGWCIKKLIAKQQKSELFYTQIMGLTLLAGCLIIPFWPRYFLLILPWVTLSLAEWLSQAPVKLTMAIICIIIGQWLVFLWPQPAGRFELAVSRWNAGYFHDFATFNLAQGQYLEPLTTQTKLAPNQPHIKLNQPVPMTRPWDNQLNISVSVGDSNTPGKVTLLRHHNQWYIDTPSWPIQF
jgi:hypothetical protein